MPKPKQPSAHVAVAAVKDAIDQYVKVLNSEPTRLQLRFWRERLIALAQVLPPNDNA